jgi:alpha-L-rhamnosidase
MPGWQLPDYNGATDAPGRWSQAAVLESPLIPGVGVLRAQVMPRVEQCETFAPRTVKWFPGEGAQLGVWVVDFGQNIAGTVRLTIPEAVLASAPAGSNVTVRHAETVWPNGTLHHLYGRAIAETVTVIVAGGTTSTDATPAALVFEPRFTYMGFRYIEISGAALARHQGPDVPVGVVAHFVHSNLDRTGRLTTSSPVLSGIVRAAEYSQLASWMSVPTDCTQRERRGWLGDASLAAEGQVHTVFAAPAYVKFLDDIALTQTDEWAAHNGSIPEVCPNYGHGAIPPDPPFGVGYAVLWWNHYRYYADAEALATHYGNVSAFAETLIVQVRGGGGMLDVSSHGDWVSVANSTIDATTCSAKAALDHHANSSCCLYMECPDFVLSGFYYILQLRILHAAATVLGKIEDSTRWAALEAEATTALASSQYKPIPRTLGYGYQTDQALALALGSPGGVLPRADVDSVVAALVTDVDRHGGHLK